MSSDDLVFGSAFGEVLRGGAGADQLNAGDGDDQVFGEAGDDRLEGGRGNDLIDGGNGTDTAVFRGNRSAYAITFDSTTATTTLVSTAEGTDTVRGVEKFEFANLTLDASALIDTTAPTAQGFNPPDGATGVAVAANITVTFSEAVEAGSGRIVLSTAAGAVVESFDAVDRSRIRFDGASLVIDPSAELMPGTGYRLAFDAAAVRDLAGNPVPAFHGPDFTTAAQPLATATLQLFAFHWKSHELLPNLALELRAPGEAAPLAASTDVQGSAAFAGLEPGPASLAAPTATPASGRAAADAAVNLQDAVAILRMVAGLDLNGPGRPLSPYQTLAADVDSSGGVSLADALAVLRHAVGLPAPAPAWHLLADTDPLPRLWAATAPEAAATVPLALQAGEPATQGLVAVLRGDVDGSHSLGPGAAKLEDLHPGHLADLHTRFGLPLSQFGVYGEG